MKMVGMTREDGFSSSLKVYIESEIEGYGQVTVIGYIGEGASMTLSSRWNSPFANDTLGDTDVLSKASDIGQANTDLTTKTVNNSILNWEGMDSPSLNLPIHFKAFRNPKAEVEDAIMFLQMMESPELSKNTPFGRVPKSVDVTIGRRLRLLDCVILDVTDELDSPKTRDGYRTENTVQIQIQRKRILNQSEIPSIYK